MLLYNGFNKKSTTVIPYFTYLPKSRNRIPSTNEPVILCLGRIVEAKGMHHLLRALKEIQEEAQLVIVGDGPAINELKFLSGKLGVSSRVYFSGWLSHDKLDSLYRQCSVVVVPSVWPEPFGIVGIEAMAYQKPVVAFEVGGISQWLENGKTGFLVPCGDERELAGRINLLLEKRELAGQMGRKARLSAEKHFMPEAHLKSLISVFKKAINEFSEGQ